MGEVWKAVTEIRGDGCALLDGIYNIYVDFDVEATIGWKDALCDVQGQRWVKMQ